MRLRYVTLASLMVVCLWTASVAANPSAASNEAAAQKLFDDAMQLMAAGEYAKACPEFEESQRLDPGMGTQYNLADCYEKTGRTASAWALFTEVADQALKVGDSLRERVARQRTREAAQHLSRLTVRVPYPVDGMQIRRDGTVLGYAMWGSAVPVDPGMHEIEVTAPGKQPWRTSIGVPRDRANIEVDVPNLRDMPLSVLPSASVGTAAALKDARAAPRPGSVQRTWAVVSAGLGVVSIGAGVALAVWARGTYTSASCDAQNACTTPRDVERRNDAIVRADLANIPWAIGAVGVGLGVTLWLTAPKPGRTHPAAAISVAPTGVALGGRF